MSVTIHVSVEELAKHEAELRAEMIRELRPYLGHKANCLWFAGWGKPFCDCGLSVILGEKGE